MKQNDMPVNAVAMTTNVVLAVEMVERITNRTGGLEGMAVLYGPSGFGKTWAISNAANMSRAYFVTMRWTYTVKDLLEHICREMGLSEEGRIGRLVDRIAQQLAISGRALFIDEVDHLVKKRKIELVRDIYDMSHAPIVMIGEELLPKKLEQWERVHRRVMTWVGAEPVSQRDVGHLANLYCPGIEIAPEVIERMMRTANGSTGRVANTLEKIREHCAVRKLRRAQMSDMPDAIFPVASAPRARTNLMGAAS